jgi:Flp pilus assembly protein TadG
MELAAMHVAKQMTDAGAARRGGRPGRFLRSEAGGAATEFALVMLPFLTVLMVIIQSAIVLLAGQVLQTAATNAARLILTGQAQTGSYSAAQFKSAICANLTVMFNCTNNLYVDVASFSNFIVVRLMYQWPIIAAGIGFCAATACGLVNSTGNTNTLVATVAFRNEPYTPGT